MRSFPRGWLSVRSLPRVLRRSAADAAGLGRENQLRTLGHLAVAGELQPTCQCDAAPRPGIVLDPFMGSGTVASTATRHGRHWLGIELNPAFADLAKERLSQLEQRPPPRLAA